MRKRWIIPAGAALVCLLAAFFVLRPSGDGHSVASVDGFPVAEEEFRLFLDDKKAAAAAHFYAVYGAQVDSGFWNRAYDGQTPLEYARELALTTLTESKMEDILLHERGLVEDIGYAALMGELKAKNEEQERKMAAGETAYGLKVYTPLEFYSYTRSQRYFLLVDSQVELEAPVVEDAALRAVYAQNLDRFSRGMELTYERAEKGRVTTAVIVESEIPKEDAWTLQVYQLLSALEEGASVEIPVEGGTATLTLTQKTVLGHASFEESRTTVLRIYAEERLKALLEQRVREAKVVKSAGFHDISFS